MAYIHQNKIFAPYLEYNLTEHCNLRCRYCSQFAPYNPVHYAEIDAFKKDVEALAQVYHAFRFRFVGGEPLLHSGLLEFINVVRNSRLADKVVVCTNGKILHTMSREFYLAIDEIDISWYPDSGKSERLTPILEKASEFAVQSFVKHIRDFELGWLGREIEDTALTRDIFDSCRIAHVHHCHTFYNGHYYKCSKPLFANNYFNKLGVRVPDLRVIDGVSLHQPDLMERLVSHLQDNTPLESCKYCLGTVGKRVPWQQLEGEEIKRPPVLDGNAAEYVDRVHMKNTLAKRRLFRILRRNKWLHPLRGIYSQIFRLDDYWDRVIGVGTPL